MTARNVDGEIVLCCDYKECPLQRGFNSSDLIYTLERGRQEGWKRKRTGSDYKDYCKVHAEDHQ